MNDEHHDWDLFSSSSPRGTSRQFIKKDELGTHSLIVQDARTDYSLNGQDGEPPDDLPDSVRASSFFGLEIERVSEGWRWIVSIPSVSMPISSANYSSKMEAMRGGVEALRRFSIWSDLSDASVGERMREILREAPSENTAEETMMVDVEKIVEVHSQPEWKDPLGKDGEK